MPPIQVFVVDDHAIFRRGLAALVQADARLAWAGEASGGSEAIRSIPAVRPDVVVVDMVMPARDGLKAVQALRPLLPHTRFVALSCSLDGAAARAALDAGVTGYLLKTATPHELVQAIHAAYEGRRAVAPEVARAIASSERSSPLGGDLTRRERDLLALMACGLANQEISQRLDIGLPTVKFHVTNIMAKLQAENRTAAVLAALRHKLVDLEPSAAD
jgi:NarL family two-component system response regulator LiaR